jgi:AmiR/NasT family two-component response regulator
VRDELNEALTSRAVIDQAKGMIMQAQGCDADEAFSLLVRMSSHSNRKVRDLAREFVDHAGDRSKPQRP